MGKDRLELLEEKYSRLPKEIKEEKRWVCYNKVDKVPMNALSGQRAMSNNPLSWTTFNTAIRGCVKYNFDGIGFMLGNGIFGVDLDNHENENGQPEMSKEEFEELGTEFISSLQSYAERSQSGKGIHIICKGKLPSGARRKGNIEMYDSGRYFAMTGDVINDMPIEPREDEITKLWEKYLNVPQNAPERVKTVRFSDGSVRFGNYFEFDENYGDTILNLSDNEIIDRIKSSKNGADFVRLYNGDLSQNGDDHSSADLSLCTILAFWCGKNITQMDRIFRSSGLMRDKWDRMTGDQTYGMKTILKAIDGTLDTYVPPKEKVNIPVISKVVQQVNPDANEVESSIDENGDPIIKSVNKTFKTYSLDDTGNAERFYDYFGHLFKYNTTNKVFMYWDNMTWVVDNKNYVKKYADEMIKFLKQEAQAVENNLDSADENGLTDTEKKKLERNLNAMRQNITRISNKSGKDAMISELEHIHDIPVESNEFDRNGDYLNTLSGVVNLSTGDILPFNQKYMLSKNTKQKVSYEEPTVWLKFLNEIFKRPNQSETEEIIDCIQKAIGYSLSDSIKEQCMFILHGDGSNGKSTFIEELCYLMGDYAVTGDSDILIQNKNNSGQSTQFSLAGYKGTRLISVSETDEGNKFAEARVKAMTGNAQIRAQEKYGKPFTYNVTYKIWLATNPKPIIRGTDLGIWRRLYYFPFERTFTDKEKDVTLPSKLKAESAKILGWAIKGYQRYLKEGLSKPRCLEEAIADYKQEMDVISTYLSQRCQDFPNYRTRASILYEDYKKWAGTNNEYLMSETKFGKELGKKGYEKIRQRDGIFYIGLKLYTDTRGQIFSAEEEVDDNDL